MKNLVVEDSLEIYSKCNEFGDFNAKNLYLVEASHA